MDVLAFGCARLSDTWGFKSLPAINGRRLTHPVVVHRIHLSEKHPVPRYGPAAAIGSAGRKPIATARARLPTGFDLPLLAALSRQWRAAVDAGHGREDISAARLALRSP